VRNDQQAVSVEAQADPPLASAAALLEAPINRDTAEGIPPVDLLIAALRVPANEYETFMAAHGFAR